MDGLIEERMTTTQNETNTQQPAKEPMQDQGGQSEQADQEAYEKVIIAGSKILYDEQTNPGIMKMIEDGQDDMPNTLAQIVLMIFEQLDEQSNGQVPQQVIIPAASDLLIEVIELTEEAGIADIDDQTEIKATSIILKSLFDKYGVTEEEVRQYLDTLSEEDVKGYAGELQQQGEM